jgi:hypothetical protein
LQVSAYQAFEGKIVPPGAQPTAADLPIESKPGADGKFGDRMRRVRGNPHDGNPIGLGHLEVDVVASGAAQSHKLRAALGELCQDGCIEAIVDEHADRREARGQRGRGALKGCFQEDQLVLERAVGLLERVLVVRVVAENSDSHENFLLGN